jgi:hypothetical protein
MSQNQYSPTLFAFAALLASVFLSGIRVDAQDCNSNGVNDSCDIDCGGPMGPCDLLNCGGSTDCNSNGIPDECEADPVNAALDFDGVDDFVVVPDDAGLNLTSGFTIEAWVTSQTQSGFKWVVAKGQGGAAGYGFGMFDDKLAFGTFGIRDYKTLGAFVPLDAWTHLAAAFDNLADAHFYVNGAFVETVTGTSPANVGAFPLHIGSANLPPNGPWDGAIDEVRIWNTMRTEQEIADNLAQRLIGNEPGLVAYWRMNESQDQDVFDATMGAHHGTLGADAMPGGDASDPSWIAWGSPVPAGDCNTNGTLDVCDISGGIGEDCNSNSIPDDCEPGGLDDCNSNGTPDPCDVFSGFSGDCNSDGTPDDCELDSNDANNSGVPDDCEFFMPTDRAKSCGRVYLVPNDATDALRAYARDLTAAGVFRQGAINQSRGTLGVDSDGNFLVGQLDQDTVLVIAPDGTLVRTIAGGGLNGPHGTALTPSGNVAVCSFFTDSVMFFAPDGTFLSNLGPNVSDPQALAYDRSGNLYVGNRNNGNGHVAVFDENLQFVGTIGSGFFNPHPLDMAFDRSQKLFVTTPGYILKFDCEGTFLGIIVEAGLDPAGLAVDESDVLWVTNRLAREIWRFLPSGQFVDKRTFDAGVNLPANLELYGIAFDQSPEADCNTNGTGDACDIDSGLSADCNFNGQPDECELPSNDCNGNGTPDDCEPDCNANGTPDECELTENDCNSNGRVDSCDLDDGPDVFFDDFPTDVIDPAKWSNINNPNTTGSPFFSPPFSVNIDQDTLDSVEIDLSSIPRARLSYWWRSIETENGDDLESQFWNGSQWTLINHHSGGPDLPDWQQVDVELPIEARHAGFKLRFQGLVSNNADDWFIDDVRLFLPSSDCNTNGTLDECEIGAGSVEDCNTNGIPDECELAALPAAVDCNSNGTVD